ncbi:MAG: hypothetical protein RMJ37_06275 [Spirochaetia bacterium]|nr:hypothetical protein [Spirochaetota bacterium]MCX8096203.1 hypothetical protein [Spirochaetota bacterium]MDW8112919.1 hypothetical protein [Spirochaetia bacterium]
MRKLLNFVIAIVMIALFSNFSFSETVQEIESILMNHVETGYKFVKKLGNGSWKVNLTTSSGYSKDVYVYVSFNKNNPDFDIVYVYTGIRTYTDDELQKSFNSLVSALQRNSAPSEWGTFSLYKDKGTWYLDYNVKLRRVYADETHLMNAIGWVVGASSVYEEQF